MSIYQDLKELYRDIKKDKIMIILLRSFGFILIFLFIIITYKAIYQPVNILGIELNRELKAKDTIRIVIHDTLYIEKVKNNEEAKSTAKEFKVDVKSINQKGGQTANQIINNK